MASSLASSFLKDFEDEAVEEPEENDEEEMSEDMCDAEGSVTQSVTQPATQQHDVPLVPVEIESFVIPDAVEEYIEQNTRPKEKLVKLLQKPEFLNFIEDIKKTVEEMSDGPRPGRQAALRTLATCNDYLRDVDVEILGAYAFIRDLYNNRFPELEPLLPAPLDYINAATRLKNELDVATTNLSDILPSTTVMTVTVAASITIGRPLSPLELDKMLSVADEVMELVEARKVILAYIEKDLLTIAPNLSALVGSSMAARLLVYAESLENLSSMPSGNIPLLGGSAHARATTAFATNNEGSGALPSAARSAGKGYGILWQSDIVQSTPIAFRVRALKLLAGKCGLAARRDAHNRSTDDDSVGRQLRDQVLATLKRIQEPPPPTQKKPLPVPDDRPRPRRGGKRYRRMKEKYGMTELKKQQNRLEMKV
eukprot:Blabericola_migrator_1__4785@NODE_2516_length_2656_cov_130_398223_g1574_i0_p1_GENE_NODE_2516_length_2656_cov_130_398223_g1574_i0NODE_2516_length_2656_cov_130_398223_g1574_i0_p1_ORF_typecomplete_len425_score99_01Nop/PF01798_18/1_2e50Prp31_C/PF09785_9/1_1e14Mrx7/PF10906_8/0_49Mrx7/PF10906_8/1_2e03_NODE_2516_length_2656_cov_130_398223_g1574_i013292603